MLHVSEHLLVRIDRDREEAKDVLPEADLGQTLVVFDPHRLQSHMLPFDGDRCDVHPS